MALRSRQGCSWCRPPGDRPREQRQTRAEPRRPTPTTNTISSMLLPTVSAGADTLRRLSYSHARPLQTNRLSQSVAFNPVQQWLRLINLKKISAVGTSRHFAATQQFSRFRSEADIQRAALQNRIYKYAPRVLHR